MSNSGHHRFGLDPRLRHKRLDGLGDDGGVHDLALDDRIVPDRRERHLGENGAIRGVRDRDELDQAAADVQADRRRLPPEESHMVPGG